MGWLPGQEGVDQREQYRQQYGGGYNRWPEGRPNTGFPDPGQIAGRLPGPDPSGYLPGAPSSGGDISSVMQGMGAEPAWLTKQREARKAARQAGGQAPAPAPQGPLQRNPRGPARGGGFGQGRLPRGPMPGPGGGGPWDDWGPRPEGPRGPGGTDVISRGGPGPFDPRGPKLPTGPSGPGHGPYDDWGPRPPRPPSAPGQIETRMPGPVMSTPESMPAPAPAPRGGGGIPRGGIMGGQNVPRQGGNVFGDVYRNYGG